MNSLPTQPQSIFQVIKCGFQYSKQSFSKLYALGLIYATLATILFRINYKHSFVHLTWDLMIIASGIFLLKLIFDIMLIYRAHLLMICEGDDIQTVFSYSLKKYIKVLLAVLVVLLVISLYGLLFKFIFVYTISQAVPPYLVNVIVLMALVSTIVVYYLAIAVQFVKFAIIVDNGGIFNAFQKSIQLVWGRWWRTYVIMLFLTILMVAPFYLGDLAIYLINKFLHLALIYKKSIGMLIMLGGWSLVYPYFVNTMLCLYHDLKLRRAEKEV